MRPRLRLVDAETRAPSLSDSTQSDSAFHKLSVLMPIRNNCATLFEIVERVLTSPLPLELELVAVDGGSTDGSWELIEDLAAADGRIQAIRLSARRSHGNMVRAAIEHMTGDVAVVQNAACPCDPHDYPLLLQPILQGVADAVYGSRALGSPRRVSTGRRQRLSWLLRRVSNLINDQDLTSVHNDAKMVRADVLKQLRLTSNTPAFETELICRLAQRRARVYEVPVGVAAQAWQDEKGGGALDALRAVCEVFRCRFVDPQFTDHSGFYVLSSMSRAENYNRWILRHVHPYLGRRVMEAGSGIGSMSALMLGNRRLLLVDNEPMYVSMLRQRFGHRGDVRVDEADLTQSTSFQRWQGENLDTVLCSNVLEHLPPDHQVLRDFHQVLAPGGHCVIVVPAGRWLYTVLDQELGHYRRYAVEELRRKMSAVGFDVVYAKQFSRLGALSWAVFGHLLGRRQLGPRQMALFDRILPLAKIMEHLLPLPGMSLIMVGRKKQAAALRAVA
jgi:SAM-dependent methyltransferase